MTTPNQSLQEESDFDDISWPLLSIYYDAAKEEDDEMVGRWRNDAKGIVIFTGLFSAAVAVFLTVTVQDLRPNSQDNSEFYLSNIYQVLAADPNATRASLPSPDLKPPPFSPPRYAIWVNSLWFLSLAMSISCALWATSLQQWARRYLRRSQPTRLSLEKRAQMRAFFAGGVDKTHIPWAIEGLPALLHLSLFLFLGGLAIFLFNVNREVFKAVIWWIVFFFLVYGSITLLPILRPDSTCYSPLSTPVWTLWTSIAFATFQILAFIAHRLRWRSYKTWDLYKTWDRNREFYRDRLLDGVEKVAEKAALERPSEMYVRILDWTVSTLETSHDGLLKKFFEAIPGFLQSSLLEQDQSKPEDSEIGFTEELGKTLSNALYGFWDRTFSSNLACDSVKIRRIDISLKTMNIIRSAGVSSMLDDILSKHWDKVPHTLEMGEILACWCTNDDIVTAHYAQSINARILASVQGRGNNWVSLAARTFGLPERDRDLLDNIDGDDTRLLAVFILVTRQSLRPDYSDWMVLEALSKLDIRNTPPRLQHDFCALWNKMVLEARDQGRFSIPVGILMRIRHLYFALHKGTDPVLTAPSASTGHQYTILRQPSSYPICNVASHRPDSAPLASLPLTTQHDKHFDTSSLPDLRLAAQVHDVVEPTTSEIRATSHRPDMINRIHSSSRLTGESPAAAAPQESTSLSRPLEGSEQQESDIVSPSGEPRTSQFLSTASTLAPAPAPIPSSLVSTPSKSHEARVASDSDSSHFVPPSIGPSLSASRPTGSARMRVRGLVNTRNICFANSVLQLLVNSPPSGNLFRELVDLKGQHGAGASETGSGATPLVDAAVRFFKEFLVEEESPSTQQQSPPATGGSSRPAKAKKDDSVFDSFEPTYIYDAMEEKTRLKPLLDGKQQDAEEFFSLYLDTLDEESHGLLASISGRQSASAAPDVEEREVSQSDQTKVGSQGSMANIVELPTTRIFGGKLSPSVRAPNQPITVPTENWRSLHLNVQEDSICTVQDALAHISQPESVQVSASSLGNASQQVLIEALPAVLVLHLNRVRYAGGITKMGKSIQLAPKLEIPLDIMVPNAQRPSEAPHYKLYGVLYHHGETADSGHYTVDVLHPNGDGDTGEEVWLHIDDKAVSRIRHEDVFGGHGTERVADEWRAYLLFYSMR